MPPSGSSMPHRRRLVGQGLALAVDHPALRHGLAAQPPLVSLAVGRYRRGHIEDNRFLVPRPGSPPQSGFVESSMSRPPKAAGGWRFQRRHRADHVMRQRHARVKRRRPRRGCLNCELNPLQCRCCALSHGDFGCAFHHQMAHALSPFNSAVPGLLAHHNECSAGR